MSAGVNNSLSSKACQQLVKHVNSYERMSAAVNDSSSPGQSGKLLT
jgi:hypothetical protein